MGIPLAPEAEVARHALSAMGDGSNARSIVDHAMKLAREQLGMDVAFVSEWAGGQEVMRRLEGDVDGFGLRLGSTRPLVYTYCLRVVDGRLPPVIPDSSAIPESRDLPTTAEVGIGSYAGVPIRFSDGRQYGMLCCLSRGTSETLNDRDARFLGVIAGVIGAQLEAEERVRREFEERFALIRQVVDRGAYSVFLQPMVRLSDVVVVGMEALTRFADGTPPDVRFAAAESVGLGLDLELAVIADALAIAERLPDGQALSFNASPATIVSPAFLDRLRERAGSRTFQVEVTEHAEVSDYDELIAAVEVIRRLGGRLAVDDAGAGYSSFRHILRLRPDLIKLDMSLVRDVDTDVVRQALAGSLARFAHDLGIHITAEGVETIAERGALLRLGIDYGQGYLFGRPAPARAVLEAAS